MRRVIHNFEIVALAAALCFIGVAASSAMPLQVGDQNNDITRADIAGFDRFLDTHPAIAAELQKNPSLVNDSAYFQKHAALQAYLNDHPQISAELRQNPNAFMRVELRFDQNGPGGPGRFDNRGAHFDYRYPGTVTEFSSFLDSHPAIAQELFRDPSLANNPQYLANHSELQQYLQSHPAIDRELTQNPRGFMDVERRYDAQTSGRPHPFPRTVADFDQFLDSHPAVARELDRNPGLVNDPRYLANHPELQQYLQNHPAIDRELTQNARGFMDAERRYDAQTSGGPHPFPRTVAEFDQFLDSHPAVARELDRNPGLVNDPRYLANHPELQQYLQNHPAIDQELTAHPEVFMTAEARYDRSGDQARLNAMGGAGIRGSSNDATAEHVRSFGDFLSNHPDVAEQLRAHPTMVNSEAYISEHPELQTYLNSNPGVAQELKQNPQTFISQLRQPATSQTAGKTSTTEQAPKLTPNPPH